MNIKVAASEVSEGNKEHIFLTLKERGSLHSSRKLS